MSTPGPSWEIGDCQGGPTAFEAGRRGCKGARGGRALPETGLGGFVNYLFQKAGLRMENSGEIRDWRGHQRSSWGGETPSPAHQLPGLLSSSGATRKGVWELCPQLL